MKQKWILFNVVLVLLFHLILTGCNGTQFILPEEVLDNNSMTSSNNNSSDNLKQSEIEYNVTLDDVKNLLKSLKCDEYSSIKTIKSGNDTLLYLVAKKEGWLIIAGDKRVYPIVAESDKGVLSKINENLSAWIDCCAEELQSVKKMDRSEIDSSNVSARSTMLNSQKDVKRNVELWEKVSPPKLRQDVKTRSSETTYKWAVVSNTYCDSETSQIIIPHLIKTKWGQGAPWNEKLPYDTSNNGTCVIGCTAVAVAQLLYYMHDFLGKPNGLYHNIEISSKTISGKTSNIGFSRSNYVSNSDRWDKMALSYGYGTGEYSYVSDLMLDVGNRLNMKYSGNGSYSSISLSALANYGLTYSSSNYDYQIVRDNLYKSKPVNVTAKCIGKTGEKEGHSWIIDGLAIKTRHFVTEKHFEYTENWMYESEHYDSFDEIRSKYHPNTEYDYIIEDNGTYTSECLLMNWGWDGQYDDALFYAGNSELWIVGDYNFKFNRTINYDFR